MMEQDIVSPSLKSFVSTLHLVNFIRSCKNKEGPSKRDTKALLDLRSGTLFDPKAITVKSAEDLGCYEEMVNSEEDVSFSYIYICTDLLLLNAFFVFYSQHVHICIAEMTSHGCMLHVIVTLNRVGTSCVCLMLAKLKLIYTMKMPFKSSLPYFQLQRSIGLQTLSNL